MEHEPIHQMFSRVVKRFHDRPALEWGGGAFSASYLQVERWSDRLASRLAGAGVAAGVPVMILSENPAEVVVGMLAVLKAGGAFVPLDRDFPTGRLEAILEEVGPRHWLISRALRAEFEHLTGEGAETIAAISLDGDDASGAETPPPPKVALDPEAFCYAYFTSGSTGRPKAIAGRLKAIDHFIRWEIEEFGIGPAVRVSQLTSPAFDAFLRDAFVPLACGGTVCIPPDREIVLDGARLKDWIDRQRIHLVHCTPSVFRTLLSQDLDPERFAELRYVLLAGEPLLPSDVRRWRAVFGDRIGLVNLYGPSETTMVKFFHRVRAEDADAAIVPIGKPMPGARAIVLDDRLQPCPPGKLGEIFIRTPYRALGYLGRPDLTAEAFVSNPLSQRTDDIVYRTGDLGRLRDDGDFELIGRRDQQVKVRGVRIELSPIEETLRSCSEVEDAAVVARDDAFGNKFLCAYVVFRREVERERVRDHLLARLPAIAVPSAFVSMESLPRTLTGKLDRRALPSPGGVGGRLGPEYAPPRTPVEEVLCGLFGNLLNLPQVGVHDNFFQIGGHSLVATLLLSRVRSALGVELPLRDLFQRPTPEELAVVITRLRAEQETEEELGNMISEIAGLSEEELGELIEEERRALETQPSEP